MNFTLITNPSDPAVIPVLLGPLQVLIVALPALLMALLSIISAMARPKQALKLLKLIWRQKMPIAAVIILILAVRYVLETGMPGSAPVTEHMTADGNDWAMFRGGTNRTGTVPGDKGPLSAGINWVWKDKKEAYLSSPAVSGGRVYATSAGIGVLNRSGNIYCLDRETGSLLWKEAPEDYQPTFSSPVISGDYLVCGEGVHVSRGCRIVAMDISGAKPRIAWALRTASHVECTPVVHDGRVFVGAGDDGYYCIELEPDGEGNPVVLWHLEGADYPDAETALAVYENRVYAGLGKGGEALCVLDAASGKEIRRIPTGFPVFTPPSIYAGRLYIGMGNGDYVNSASEIGAAEGGEVWCIDLETLEKIWVYRCGSTVLGAICAVDEGIYFTTRDGQVNLLDEDGRLVASRDLAAVSLSSPAVAEECLYQITAAGHIYALERETLEVRWHSSIGSGSKCVSSPAVASGRIYVGTERDGLVCAGSREVEPGRQSWTGHLGGQGSSGNPFGDTAAELGNFLWQYPGSQAGENSTRAVTSPPASINDRLYVPFASAVNGLACMKISKPGHETPDALWFYNTPNGVVRSPAATENRVLITDTGDTGKSGHLHCVAADDGSLIWKKALSAGASGFMALNKNKVLVQDGAESLSQFDMEGKLLWVRQTGVLKYAPSLWRSMAILSTDDGKSLEMIDIPTGSTLWKCTMEHPAETAPIIHKGDIIVGTSRGLEYRAITDGGLIVALPTGSAGCSGTIAIDRNRVICAAADGTGLFECSSRQLTFRYEITGILSNPVVSADGRILVLSEDGLMAFDSSGAKPGLWADTSWMGKPCSNMILHNQSIYLGISGWGLVCIGGEE